MISTLRKISPYFDKYQSFPYVHTLSPGQIEAKFEIHNLVEDYRITKWGGEQAYIQEIIDSLNSDEIFYDIGASVGLVSVLAAAKLKTGKVISFEPDPGNLIRLKRNYEINDFTNYEILSMAVGEKKDKLKLFTTGSEGRSPSLKKVNGYDNFVEVEVDSIDNILQQKNLPHPTTIKIDVEGAEYWVLKGMSNLLSSSKKPKKIFMEIHPLFLPDFNSKTSEILSLLFNNGYEVENLVSREDQILGLYTAK